LRTVLVALIAMLVLVACGGSDTTDDVTTPDPVTEDTAEDGEIVTEATTSTTQSSDDEAPADSSDVGTASVTIGDQTFEFTENTFCTGSVFHFHMPGNTQAAVSITTPPPGVEVDLPDSPGWIADSERTGAEESSVDSFTIEGGESEEGTPYLMSGTATFYNSNEGLVEGSFEASCAG